VLAEFRSKSGAKEINAFYFARVSLRSLNRSLHSFFGKIPAKTKEFNVTLLLFVIYFKQFATGKLIGLTIDRKVLNHYFIVHLPSYLCI
jgi:hypothetical protein